MFLGEKAPENRHCWKEYELRALEDTRVGEDDLLGTGGGGESGGMEGKEGERMVVRDKQYGGDGKGRSRWVRSETDGSRSAVRRFDQKMTVGLYVTSLPKKYLTLSHPSCSWQERLTSSDRKNATAQWGPRRVHALSLLHAIYPRNINDVILGCSVQASMRWCRPLSSGAEVCIPQNRCTTVDPVRISAGPCLGSQRRDAVK